jgi:putative membrane protein
MAALPFLLRLVAIALGLGIAQWTADTVAFRSAFVFVVATFLLGVLNTLLKPVLVLLMLPFVVLTLGIGLWVVNAILVMLASALLPGFDLGGWGAAFWSALWISLFSLGAQALAGGDDQRFRRVVVQKRGFRRRDGRGPGDSGKKNDDDVIDI